MHQVLQIASTANAVRLHLLLLLPASVLIHWFESQSKTAQRERSEQSCADEVDYYRLYACIQSPDMAAMPRRASTSAVLCVAIVCGETITEPRCSSRHDEATCKSYTLTRSNQDEKVGAAHGSARREERTREWNSALAVERSHSTRESES